MFKLLIVDDEPIIRQGMKSAINWCLADIDTVFLASSAEEALEIIKNEDILVLITDIRMEKMSGIELIHQVRKIRPSTRTIVMTAFDEFEYARQSLRLGVDDFLVKPVDEKQLLDLVMRFSEEKRQEMNQKQLAEIRRRVVGSFEQKQLNKQMCLLAQSGEFSREIISQICEIYDYSTEQAMQAVIFYPRPEFPDNSIEHDYLTYAIQDFCSNNIDLCGHGITFLDNKERIVIAFFCEQENNKHKGSRIGEFISLLNSEFHISQKVALGSIVNGFGQFHISYHEAICLMDDSQSENNNIVEISAIKRKNQLFWDVFSEIKYRVLLESGDGAAVLHAFHTFSKMTESYDLSLTYVRQCCFEIAMTAYYGQAINQWGIRKRNIQEFTEAVVTSDIAGTLEITKAFIENLYEIQEDIHETVELAKKYIKEHLSEKMSVSSIAQMNYLAPAYFSRLFKKVEGEGCNEYIVRVRMEKAEYLLRETDMKTGEIALQTGYSDKNYFSLTFKKYAGISPTAYRAKFRNLVE